MNPLYMVKFSMEIRVTAMFIPHIDWKLQIYICATVFSCIALCVEYVMPFWYYKYIKNVKKLLKNYFQVTAV